MTFANSVCSLLTQVLYRSEFREADFKSEDQYWQKKRGKWQRKNAPNFSKPDYSKYKKEHFYYAEFSSYKNDKKILGQTRMNQAGDAWDRENTHHLPHDTTPLSVFCCASTVKWNCAILCPKGETENALTDQPLVGVYRVFIATK